MNYEKMKHLARELLQHIEILEINEQTINKELTSSDGRVIESRPITFLELVEQFINEIIMK